MNLPPPDEKRDRIVGVLKAIELGGDLKARHGPGTIIQTTASVQRQMEAQLPGCTVDLTPLKLPAAVKWALKQGGND